MTLRQMFEFGDPIDRRNAVEVMEREAMGYRAAEGVMTLSQWAADSVVLDYGVPKHRVRACVPGANIDPDIYSAWSQAKRRGPTRVGCPLRLVFVGKYWQRKGLDRLLAALRIARSRGADLTLRVIGVDRNTVPQAHRGDDGVEWVGFIDKRVNALKFFDAVSDRDIGCLLSRADASPIAVREYAALGLVTLCTTAGGSPEMAFPEASFPVPVDATSEAIADTLVAACNDRSAFEQMRNEAWQRRHRALWAATVEQMLGFIRATTAH